jgi:hypothetical protein
MLFSATFPKEIQRLAAGEGLGGNFSWWDCQLTGLAGEVACAWVNSMQQLCMYLRVQGVRAAAYFCPSGGASVKEVHQHQSVLGRLKLQQGHAATSGGTP